MALVQVFNKRSKKWVLLDAGKKSGILKMQAEKFEGIPVKGEPSTPDKKMDGKNEKAADSGADSAFWGLFE